MKAPTAVLLAATAALTLAGCAGEAEPQKTRVTVGPSSYATPAGTGDIEQDLAALGVQPENFENYYERMTEALCESELGIGVPVGFESYVARWWDGQAHEGVGADVLRLIVADACPSREDDLEAALATHEAAG